MIYQFPNEKIIIETKHGSMIPSPYSILLAKNIPKLKSESIVIDIGCGSGILGIMSYMRGSDNVIMTDITDNAISDTLDNLKLNKIISGIKVIKSNMFSRLSKINNADLIICNPPSLPSIINKVINKPEYFSGNDGRKIIDHLLLNSHLILKDKGKILMTHTSLANINKTINLIKELNYTLKIIDKLELKFRDFYDINHIKKLNNNNNLYVEKDNQLYEIVYVLEITVSKSSNILKSKL
jgi:HemK-related putative methylase